MSTTSRRRRRHTMAIAALVAISTAFGGGLADAGGEEDVTITWWHIQNNPPMLDEFQAMADEFMAEHPNVTIEITVQENEAFKDALQVALQANEPPDIFQSWGGGGMRAQVEAGLLQDVTDATADWIDTLNPGAVAIHQLDGRQYGVPYTQAMVGFWYNKALFAEAGIEAPPTTWEEFLTVVQQLKDAGITPIAVGAGDKWPAHFYWTYLALRIGGSEAIAQVVETGDWTAEPFVRAGEEVARLVELEPFQEGYLAATWPGPDGESAAMGNAQAAMDLMGPWAPNAFETDSASGDGITADLGWFPFPAVDGGAGDPKDGLGGSDGWVVGRDAEPEAIEFVRYLTEVEQASRGGAAGAFLPATVGSEASVEAAHQQLVLAGMAEAPFIQLYLDQFFSPELGGSINDAVALLFAGEATAEEVAQMITDAAAAG